MKEEHIKRSGIILGVGAICGMLLYPTILFVLFAIDLLLFAITLFLSGWEETSGTVHSKRYANTVMQSSQAKRLMR